MCSIIGICSKKGEDVSRKAFTMLSEMQHRGPEAFGICSQGSEKKSKTLKGLLPLPESRMLLGHSLLSNTGYCVQPITMEGISVSHNGQIYNHRSLAGEGLSSDSEAIPLFLSRELKTKSLQAALRSFMEKAIGEYAVGMFCNGGLYAFRDFTGQKPLWFGESDSVYAFASEIGALAKIGIASPAPLEPGHLLRISEKGFSGKKIFTMQDFREKIPKKYSMQSLEGEFRKTIAMQCEGLKKAAVLFSGGIDSSLVAKAVSEQVPRTALFVAGAEDSHDIKCAQQASKELGLKLEKVLLGEKNIEALVPRVMGMLREPDEMQIGIGVPELACAKAISAKGFKVAFSGQGSDEIFCGYSVYPKILAEKGFNAVEQGIWSGLSRMPARNFYRDDVMLAAHSLELRLPFMSKNFLAEAMAFPAEEKIKSPKDGLAKHPVRALGKIFGLPDSITQRPKKALQYGSGSQKMVSKFLKNAN